MAEKKTIYYARTYRHLKGNLTKSILYLLILVLPSLVIFILNLQNITRFIANQGVAILGKVFPGIPMYIVEDKFSILGTVEYIDMPTVYPDFFLTFINLSIMVLVLFFLGTGKKKGSPLAIYFMLSMLVHVVNCIYFLFAANHFPYSAFQFSDLYMKQQIGIWITFIVLAGLVTGFIGGRGYRYKILAFLGIIAYSIIFGGIRYILFLYILQRFSILYMALMFFVFGPLFDFLYLVAIYSMLVNKMVKIYDSGEGREDWKW